MDQRITALYSDTILNEAMRRYGIALDHIKPLEAFESFIYQFERAGETFILRIGHSFRKSLALVEGEVDWINFLARGGVSVARAIPSQSGHFVEAIDDGQGGQFLVTAFVRAPGQPPWDVGWTAARFEAYGTLLGKMHALAVDYRPNPAWKRPEWDDLSMNFIELYLPASEVAAHQKYQAVMKHIYSLPKDQLSYGLIHQDAHQNNFFMDSDGTLTLFDFDDCAYSWFISDIAIVLFYISLDAQELGYPSAAEFTREFMTCFLRGYRKTFPLDPKWLAEVPVFLKLRELELYAVVHRDFDIAGIDHWQIDDFMHVRDFDSTNSGHVWIANFMRDRKPRIDADLPFIDFDFESLA